MKARPAVIGIIAGLAIAVVAAQFATRRAPKPDPRIEQLASKVADLTLRFEAIERQHGVCIAGVAAVHGEVTLVRAQVKRLERVVPVQAIRDRARAR